MNLRPLLPLLLLSAALLGCRDEVPLGSWGKSLGDSGTSTPELPECLAVGEPGTTTPGGAMLGVTLPYTDWNWPAPFDSIEWNVRIERESVSDGYLWANEVHFAGGATVLIALQSQGGYQADPPAGPVERTKIVQFWISGPPLEAELVDIPYPDARAFQTVQAGSDWWTINARYDWTVCRAYRLKVLLETSEPGVGVWYGGWIVDTETGVETQIGRMLVPAEWGRLTAPASSWTNRIGWTPLAICADAESVAAIFGAPLVDGARPEAVAPTNRFSAPPACPDTRFDDFPDAVRQEVGFSE